MQLSEIINVNRIKKGVDVLSKKRALEELSHLITEDQTQLNATEIFDNLISRERLGSTGVGYGIAIPHGRVKNCENITGAFIQLDQGIDFDAMDNQPVDILFALIVPEESTDEHLQVLALLASMFNDESFRLKLRQSQNEEELYQLLTEWHKPN
ncbi:MAG: PTS IIA-like nitrogen regulatory protein PtsN [Gammaproteobacteria bacterium]|nr:PTS IIA-like nitrogen regulatory protein PtsN [Gammaproteobacteria bacterium]MCW8988713.1 PTS IIA-like nitrogen regulatory protein PtsN [Gammaproteobacteria bacterium]MCW9030926.1 PTS IIA-like nitrogen regulatory protein PtsN [Gammaproteobacteria bacterium]